MGASVSSIRPRNWGLSKWNTLIKLEDPPPRVGSNYLNCIRKFLWKVGELILPYQTVKYFQSGTCVSPIKL